MWLLAYTLENCFPCSNCAPNVKSKYLRVPNLTHAALSIQLQVGRTRSYTPIADDIGHTLKYEVVAVDSESGQELETPTVVQLAGRVFPLPAAPLRTLLPVEGSTSREHPSNFTVMTYNVLADLYATVSAAILLHTLSTTWRGPPFRFM